MSLRFDHDDVGAFTGSYQVFLERRRGGGAWDQILSAPESHPGWISVEHIDEGGGTWSHSGEFQWQFTDVPGDGLIEYRMTVVYPGTGVSGKFLSSTEAKK